MTFASTLLPLSLSLPLFTHACVCACHLTASYDDIFLSVWRCLVSRLLCERVFCPNPSFFFYFLGSYSALFFPLSSTTCEIFYFFYCVPLLSALCSQFSPYFPCKRSFHSCHWTLFFTACLTVTHFYHFWLDLLHSDGQSNVALSAVAFVSVATNFFIFIHQVIGEIENFWKSLAFFQSKLSTKFYSILM